MAKGDAERYKKGMEVYYKEELALMCSGAISSPNEDSKPSASESLQVQATTSAPAFAAAAGASLAAPATDQQTKFTEAAFHTMNAEQLIQLQNMLQQQGYASINKEEMIMGISSARASIKQRLVEILKESEALQMKDKLMEQLMTSCLAALQPSSAPGFGLAQAAFPHFGQAASLLGGAGNGFSLGQVGGLPDNSLLLNQFLTSQQLQQQLGGSGLSGAASLADRMPNAAGLQSSDLVTVPTQSPNTESASKKSPSGQHLQETQNADNSSTLGQFIASQQQLQLGGAAAPNLSLSGLASMMAPSLGQQVNMNDSSLLNQYLASQQLLGLTPSNQLLNNDENADKKSG